MNITINLSTANLEIVNSNIISKLYNLISGNSLHNVTLSGNLYSSAGYKLLIDTLMERFSPNLIITVPVEGQYLIFTDSALETALRSTIGDGEGITLAALKNANPNSSLGLKYNTNIIDARELCLVEGTDTNNGCVTGCTNLKILGIPYKCIAFNPDWGRSVVPEKIVVKDMLNWVKTTFNGSNINRDNGWDLYITLDGVNIERVENLTLPEGGTFSGLENNSPFYSCKSLKNITVPASYTIIRGFHNSSIESLTFLLDSLLTDIGYLAFRDCTNLVFNVANIPLTVTNISEKAFRNCSGVTGILNLPNLISLSNLAFFASHITGATNLGSITLIPNECFQYSALQSITLPSTCTIIKSRGLSDMTTLTTVSGGSGLTTIEGYAFYNDTNLTSVAELSNVTSIGEAAFQNCPITGTLNLPNLTTLGVRAFYNTRITSVNFGHNITLLSDECFRDCSNLSYIYGLENVTHIGTQFAHGSKIFTDNDVLHFDNATASESAITEHRMNNTYLCHMYFPKLTIMPGSHSSGHWSHYGFFTSLGSFGCSFVYFRDISVVKPGTFSWIYIKNFVINNTTPPTVTGIVDGDSSRQLNKIFDNSQIENIYVPDESISAYQNSDFLSSYLLNGYMKNNVLMYPQLRGMSELTHYATEADWVAAGKPADGIIDAYM